MSLTFPNGSGGRWNPANQDLLVLAAFPCHGVRGSKDGAAAEAQVRRKMASAGLSLVGPMMEIITIAGPGLSLVGPMMEIITVAGLGLSLVGPMMEIITVAGPGLSVGRTNRRTNRRTNGQTDGQSLL